MFEEQHRVRISDGCSEQPDQVMRSRWSDNLQPRYRHGPVPDSLRVLRAEPQATAIRGANDHREADLTPGHVAALRDLVGHDVPADGQEVAEHDLRDGTQTGHGGA